ncbi:MAG TPA: acyl carrier protein [Terriglobales bacterium]|nr:acyl carrier protein [Terriglobales bacterium]
MVKPPTAAKKAAHPAKPVKAPAKETLAASKNGNGGGKNGPKKPETSPKATPKAVPKPALGKPAPKPTPKPAAAPGKTAGAKPAAAPSAPAKPAPPPPKPIKPRSDLATKIVHLIAEEMAIEEAELTATASFKEDLGLDEIDVAELLMQAEHAFGVHAFSEADWESCETVDDFVQLITRRVEAKRGKKPAAKE